MRQSRVKTAYAALFDWKRADVDQKQRLQNVFFSNGLKYHPENQAALLLTVCFPRHLNSAS
jgi:hypothetical protein